MTLLFVCCVGNLYLHDVEAADADTYICEAHFADDTVLTAGSTLHVISKSVHCHAVKRICMYTMSQKCVKYRIYLLTAQAIFLPLNQTP